MTLWDGIIDKSQGKSVCVVISYPSPSSNLLDCSDPLITTGPSLQSDHLITKITAVRNICFVIISL